MWTNPQDQTNRESSDKQIRYACTNLEIQYFWAITDDLENFLIKTCESKMSA